MDSPSALEICEDAQDLVDDQVVIQQFPVDPPSHDHPDISLHALVGVATPQTMWVKGFFKNIPHRIRIDSSRNHNFIDRKIAKHANCFVHPCSSFKVTISNGGTIPYRGKFHNVCISIGDYNLCSNMFSMPLCGCLTLGTQWLRTIGPIL